MAILVGNEDPTIGGMWSSDSYWCAPAVQLLTLQLVVNGVNGRPVERNALAIATSQAFKRFRGKSNYKDNGIGWLSTINALEKDMKG